MSPTANGPSNRRGEIFHELDVHDFQKVGIKRLWAQEAEMSQTAISLFQQPR